MRFAINDKPTWAGKPKTSPLDDDADYQKLVAKITAGTLKPEDSAGLYIEHEADGKRLGLKHPARTVRDSLNRMLKDSGVEHEYRVTCRLTADEGVWGVWVTRLPAHSARRRRTA